MTGSVDEPPAERQTIRLLLNSATLPCGAEMDLLFEQVADGHAAELNDHQRDCVHCQAAFGELSVLWAPVVEQAAVPVAAPPGLTEAVMRQIRQLVRDVWYTLQTTNLGFIRIAARIVAGVARDAARTVPGVRVALGRSTHGKLAALAEQATFKHRLPHAAVGVLGRTAVVDLAVAVRYGDPVQEVARNIQKQVITTLRENIGLETVTVNVNVDDVLIDDQ
ncbi:MAG TPA: Asp23/Gls24 family envelope stress response protein [Streptosporangiaceae bacterium]